MKLEDQVLSIEQVRELQELGFDIEKHSSMCWVAYTSDEEPYEKEYSLSVLDEFCYESASLEPIPTMSIGDIIDVLPPFIETGSRLIIITHNLGINNYNIQYFNSNNIFIRFENNTQIYRLFQCLVWCIKEKHI
jgi:hypothetical protein